MEQERCGHSFGYKGELVSGDLYQKGLNFLIQLMPKNPSAWSSWNYLAQSYIDDMGVHRAHYDGVSW